MGRKTSQNKQNLKQSYTEKASLETKNKQTNNHHGTGEMAQQLRGHFTLVEATHTHMHHLIGNRKEAGLRDYRNASKLKSSTIMTDLTYKSTEGSLLCRLR